MDLSDAYANAAHIPGAEAYPARWAARAAAFRAGLGARAETGLAHGPGPREVLDLFHPEGPAQGTMVFVHGGYWRAFGPQDWSHLAAGALARGWAVAMPGYALCPEVRIATITAQVARAIECLAARTTGPLVLAGHSAGGQLVARMLAPGLLSAGVAGRLRAVMPISPLSDLRPLMQTAMNADLCLDDAEARAESPLLMAARLPVPVTVAVGAAERPAFLDQARWLAEAWGAGHMVLDGRHHFDVIDLLADPGAPMLSRLLDDPSGPSQKIP